MKPLQLEVTPGSVAYVRTTGEPVFVLDIVAQDACIYPNIDPAKAVVRRPMVTENGVVHSTENFYLQELETADAILERKLAEQKELKQLLVGEEPAGPQEFRN